jgi:hypothetical protein
VKRQTAVGSRLPHTGVGVVSTADFCVRHVCSAFSSVVQLCELQFEAPAINFATVFTDVGELEKAAIAYRCGRCEQC